MLVYIVWSLVITIGLCAAKFDKHSNLHWQVGNM